MMPLPAGVAPVLLLVLTSAVARVALRSSSGHGFRRPGRSPAYGNAGAPAWFDAALVSAAIEWRPGLAWRVWVVLVPGSAVLATMAGGAGLGVLSSVLALAAPVLALRGLAGRADAQLEAGLPDTLEATARSLRSGASLRGALAEASDAAGPALGRDLASVVHAAEHGLSVTTALDGWARARPVPGVRLATAAITLGYEAGSPARALDGVAATLRDRHALQREVRALSSQARISGVVIASAPLAFAVMAMGLDGATATFLLRTPPGLACLGAGLALDGLAAWWMTRITRSVL